MKDTVKLLVETNSPSGREEKIRNVILEQIRTFVDDYQIDSLGNLIAHKAGPGKKVLFDAHMDEIGFVATYIDENGFVKVEPIGGHNPLLMPSQRIQFEHSAIGTFWFESEYIAKKLTDYQQVSFDSLYVDLGVNSRNAALAKIRIGETATFHQPFLDLGTRWLSKAMDDRIACAALVETIKAIRHPANDLYFVFATQEEVGLVGAKPAAFRIDPDYGVAVDICGTGFLDTPKGIKRLAVKLGAGPTIKIQDKSHIGDYQLNQWIAQIGNQYMIPTQFEVLPFGGTDGSAIQTTKQGVKATTISIPCRYAHSPSEMVDAGDVQHCVQLLLRLAETSFPSW